MIEFDTKLSRLPAIMAKIFSFTGNRRADQHFQKNEKNNELNIMS
jgi:hypothetical protein